MKQQCPGMICLCLGSMEWRRMVCKGKRTVKRDDFAVIGKGLVFHCTLVAGPKISTDCLVQHWCLNYNSLFVCIQCSRNQFVTKLMCTPFTGQYPLIFLLKFYSTSAIFYLFIY